MAEDESSWVLRRRPSGEFLPTGLSFSENGRQVAMECGASLATSQPQENVRVMLDPNGHPFMFADGW
jgi:hypothetical protein